MAVIDRAMAARQADVSVLFFFFFQHTFENVFCVMLCVLYVFFVYLRMVLLLHVPIRTAFVKIVSASRFHASICVNYLC
jgi:hypothetical protein